jgi:hypothetical protein
LTYDFRVSVGFDEQSHVQLTWVLVFGMHFQ